MPSLKDFAPILSENVPLADLTSLKVGGPVRYLAEPRSVAELVSLVRALKGDRVPYRVIGGGTNILAGEAGFDGVAIRLAGEFANLVFAEDGLTAGAAVPLARLVNECAERGLSGAECLAGIPGTVGGAVIMNAGGHWGEIRSIVESVAVLSAGGWPMTVPASEITFGYRSSSLKGQVVLSAAFKLEVSEPRKVRQSTRLFLDQKRAAQDLASSSAGCVFKNPPDGPPAGALIDRAGLKGHRIGGASVSTLHANFILTSDGATAKDVFDLVGLVKDRVAQAFGVVLELEVQLW